MEPTRGQPKFTYFGGLPKELRDHIWDLAIQNRKAEPEAHFYRIIDEKQTISFDFGRDAPTPSWEKNAVNLGPPSWSDDDNPSWNHPDNPSAYLWDSGLWNACVASREAVVRRWKKYHNPRDWDTRFWHVSTKRIFEGSLERWITTRPQHDLVIGQFPNLHLSKGNMIEKNLLMPGVYDVIGHNIGLEYDSEWIRDLERFRENNNERWWSDMESRRSAIGGLSREIDYLSSVRIEMIWLVDDTFRPVDGITYADLVKDRKVFIAKGRRYIEVQLWDIGARWRLVEGTTFEQTAIHFKQLFELEFLCGYNSENNNSIELQEQMIEFEFTIEIAMCLHDNWLQQ
uniref:2EXR domain-containing protein n=1 Tax=Amphichorda felina TaxID=37994 RepID=A0A2D2AP84_AMPFL|nr:hypothetical protein [Beauveria felina]